MSFTHYHIVVNEVTTRRAENEAAVRTEVTFKFNAQIILQII